MKKLPFPYGFKNLDLANDLGKIKTFDEPEIIQSFDESQEDTIHILDVNDESYFYVNESDRDADVVNLLNNLMNK